MEEKKKLYPGDIMHKISATLQTVTVSGKDNMDKLLGCINLLDKLGESMDSFYDKLSVKEKKEVEENVERKRE